MTTSTSKNVKVVRFDWAIKYLLRDKANFDILEGFLAALLEDDGIRVLQILESEGNQAKEDAKFNRVDMLVEDSNGRKIIIEVQNTRETDYLERLLFGTSKTIVENHPLGAPYREVSKVISISIIYFNLGIGKDYLYHGQVHFKGMNIGDSLIVKQQVPILEEEDMSRNYRLEKKNIFPEYYLIQVERYQNIVTRAIDEWVYIFKNNKVEENFDSKNMNKVRAKLAEMNMNEKERKEYHAYLDSLVVEKDILETAMKEGMEKGKKKGLEEGNIHTIVTGHKAGLSLELLATLTNLSAEQVQEIIDNQLQ